MLKTHYTRLILWLIRPALDRHVAERERERDQIINAVADQIKDGGRVSESLENAYGLIRTGR